MMNNKSGKKTLLWSVIMSSPGPLVVGLGLIVGQSSTQLADFVRRSIELFAIILSFAVYCITTKNDATDELKKQKLEKGTNIFVSIAMIVSGIIMVLLALLSPSEEKGNVIPGLAIAVLGVVANSIFWFRYQKIGKEENNTILKVQSKLYCAKTFVDCSVTVALLVVLISPHADVSYFVDIVGTCIVSLYLVYTGVRSLLNSSVKKSNQ